MTTGRGNYKTMRRGMTRPGNDSTTRTTRPGDDDHENGKTGGQRDQVTTRPGMTRWQDEGMTTTGPQHEGMADGPARRGNDRAPLWSLTPAHFPVPCRNTKMM